MQPTVATKDAAQDTRPQNSYYDSVVDKNDPIKLQRRGAQANDHARSAPGFGLQVSNL